MNRSCLTFWFGVFCLATTVNTITAFNKTLDIGIIDEFGKSFEKQRNHLLCIAHSCDQDARNKIFQIEDAVEDMLSSKPSFQETPEFESLKLDEAAEYSVAMIETLEPKCKNPNYVCPDPSLRADVPQFIYTYTDAIQDMITSARNCITPDHMEEAIKVIGKCVDYAELYKEHIGNYWEKMTIPAKYAATEFKKICQTV